MRIAPAHIHDLFNLFERMLIWMEMRASELVSEEIPGIVILVLPAVNIFILSGGIRNAVFISIFKRQIEG